MTGISEASVTTPKPESGLSLRPTDAATPTPTASTSGTVTGPVVIPPQSHARPITGTSSGCFAHQAVSANSGGTIRKTSVFSRQPKIVRSVPSTTARPTPAATASTSQCA